ncbi:hypothetical protein Tco_0671607 [Tanacetum coccineum]
MYMYMHTCATDGMKPKTVSNKAHCSASGLWQKGEKKSGWTCVADIYIYVTCEEMRIVAYHSRGHGSLPKCLFRGVKSLHDTVRCKAQVEESSLETLSMDELITQLRKMCKDAEDRASNAQEEVRQKRKEALEEVV